MASTAPQDRRVILVGANPGVRLFDGDRVVAFASCWRVDWSIRGSGTAIILWRPEGVTAFSADAGLARWLANDFVQHFPELEGLPWTEPVVVASAAEVHVDLATGATATADGISIELSDALDRRAFATEEFDLGGAVHSLSLVIAPCAAATIALDGTPVPGSVLASGTPERPGSSAFATDAEVWRA